MMHWRVYAVRGERPRWRAQLCDGARMYGIQFTFYDLHGLVGLFHNHDRLYPVSLECCWSVPVQKYARSALLRRGLNLIKGPFPIDLNPF